MAAISKSSRLMLASELKRLQSNEETPRRSAVAQSCFGIVLCRSFPPELLNYIMHGKGAASSDLVSPLVAA